MSEKKCKRKSLLKAAMGIVLAVTVSVASASCGSTSGAKDGGTLKSVNDLKSVSELSVGQHVTFGVYEQDDDSSNGAEPVEWRVVAVEDDKALLITEKLLDCVQYNETAEPVTWETCTLRKWMNENFYQTVFTAEEQGKIASVTNVNPDNPEYGTAGGNDTVDKVFALNVEEAKKYFLSDEDRKAYTTEYAHVNGYDASYYVDEDGNALDIGQVGTWQLRTPGESDELNTGVSWYGEIWYLGDAVDYLNMPVRPAVWIVL